MFLFSSSPMRAAVGAEPAIIALTGFASRRASGAAAIEIYA